MKVFFVGFGKIFVAGMRQRVLNHDRFHLLDDQTGKTFGRTHGDFADRLRVEAHGGAKGEPVLLLVQDVERTNFGLHSLSDGGDQPVESFLEVV